MCRAILYIVQRRHLRAPRRANCHANSFHSPRRRGFQIPQWVHLYELWYHVHDGLIPCITELLCRYEFSKYLITKRAPFINRLLSFASQSRMSEA